MGKYKLSCSLAFILVYLFPLFLSAQTLTFDPAPAPSEPGDRGLAPQEGETNAPMDVQDRTAPAPRPPITSVDLEATMGSSGGSLEVSPGSGTGPAPSALQEGAMKATLDAQVSPGPAPRPPLNSIELQATKVLNPEPLVVPRERKWIIGFTLLLILSLVGNAFQFYRHWLFEKTLGNELLSTFNSVAWSLGRCLNKTRDLEARSAGGKSADPVILKEFREFSLDSEFMLRTLREHLGTVVRNLKQKDRKWEPGPSGVTPQELAKIEEALPEDSKSQTV